MQLFYLLTLLTFTYLSTASDTVDRALFRQRLHYPQTLPQLTQSCCQHIILNIAGTLSKCFHFFLEML